MRLKAFLKPSYPFTYGKMLPWGVVTGILAAIAFSGLLLLTGWISVSEYWIARYSFAGELAGGFALLAWFVIGISGLICLLIKVARPIGLALIIQTAIVLPAVYQSVQARWEIRRRFFEQLAERTIPLTAAIEDFYSERGTPPSSLDILVPDYISEVPRTGMATAPEYRYYPRSSRHSLRREFGAEPWVLMVFAGEFGFDRFVYVPSRKYPKRGESGWYERIGEWAYYHE